MAIVQVKIIYGPREAKDWSLEAKVNRFLKTLETGSDQLIDIKYISDALIDKAMVIYRMVPS
jgi:Sporulation protein Cse60